MNILIKDLKQFKESVQYLKIEVKYLNILIFNLITRLDNEIDKMKENKIEKVALILYKIILIKNISGSCLSKEVVLQKIKSSIHKEFYLKDLIKHLPKDYLNSSPYMELYFKINTIYEFYEKNIKNIDIFDKNILIMNGLIEYKIVLLKRILRKFR